jgi:ATP-dependent Lhr-like helicase
LYIGPLKALINDQFQRLDRLCDDLEIPVHRWHGDVQAGMKRDLLKTPAGVLLITPESLEALFVLRGTPAIVTAFTVAMAAHFLVGAARSVFTGRGLVRSGIDMFVVGLGVAVVGYFR